MIKRLKRQRYLFIMLAPALVWLILFCYVPMYGLYMAFVNYVPDGTSFINAMFHSEFVGLDWFKYFIFESGDFGRVMRNTLGTSLLTILISFPAPILIAIAVNEVTCKPFKKTVQTVSYLPYFISWVVTANIFITLLSMDGVVNGILKSLGLTQESVMFLQEGKYFWWIIAIANTWKGMGYNAIIYLAAITAINPELYEAATVDGAGRLRKIWYVTLPQLKPTIVVMLILAVGGILNGGFEQQLLMSNNLVKEYADVIDLYSFNYGIIQSNYSYATAVGMFKSVISFTLLLIVNQISKRLGEASII
ncbi:MAG: ABC transporter permease [Monoglobaceae bacterium]